MSRAVLIHYFYFAHLINFACVSLFFPEINLLRFWFCYLFSFSISSLASQFFFKLSACFSWFSNGFIRRVWFCAFSSMLSFVIIFFTPCSFSSIELSFCICSYISIAALIFVLLKSALRKALISSSAVSLSWLNFRISLWYMLLSLLVYSWFFCKFL